MWSPAPVVPEQETTVARLRHARASYYQALDDGKLDLADLAERTIDSLLDLLWSEMTAA